MRALAPTFLLISLLVISAFTVIPAEAQDDNAMARSEKSIGLPQETDSFTTVETYDSDDDGLEEIYLGGSGFTENQDDVLTEGILMSSIQQIPDGNPLEAAFQEMGAGSPLEVLVLVMLTVMGRWI